MAVDHETSERWRKDPSNWVLGIFYFNKADKRLLPPKRFKFTGWTLNFANPVSVATMLLLIVVVGLVSYVLKRRY